MITRRITHWDPEAVATWEARNKLIARRNLICTIVADHVGFSIFALWSVMAMFMPQAVYGFTVGDKFLLGATATFVGGCMRVPYTLGIAKFGGRNWTIFSVLVLIIPTLATILLLEHPGQPLWMFLLCAALTGLGGANFAASMANVNAFYPQRLRGWALATNAGLGNLGAAAVQVVGLVVLAVAGNRQPYWVCAIYLVLLVVAATAAALFMDNLDHHIEMGHVGSILRVPDSWLIMLLYICTFGSWIGFTFAFGQVLHIVFERSGQSPAAASLHALQIAFVGPMLGSLARVPGGKLSDRVGGGRVTVVVLAGMMIAAGALVVLSVRGDQVPGATNAMTVTGYVTGFISLFILAGVGNASVFKLIPSVFDARSRSLDLDEVGRRRWSDARSGALIGLTGSVGALGGVGINLALRQSYQSTGSATYAFAIFLAVYAVAAILTWQRYVRLPMMPRHLKSVVQPVAVLYDSEQV